MNRINGRGFGEMRPLDIVLGAAPYAEGSCLISTGHTRVLCTASVEEGIPSWRERIQSGWVTAEYSMLPRSTHTRSQRERTRVGGRTQEIQRLIGRSIRSVIDLKVLGLRTVTIDCDVLQADGGTRTAAITGASVALRMAMENLVNEGILERNPMREMVAAVSVGIVNGNSMLDLDYLEDSSAQVDMNVVATGEEKLIEIQGTAEGHPFRRGELDDLLDFAFGGIRSLILAQDKVFE